MMSNAEREKLTEKRRIERNIVIAREEAAGVGRAMERYGGPFVAALGMALSLADDINMERIKKAFPEYWKKYMKINLR